MRVSKSVFLFFNRIFPLYYVVLIIRRQYTEYCFFFAKYNIIARRYNFFVCFRSDVTRVLKLGTHKYNLSSDTQIQHTVWDTWYIIHCSYGRIKMSQIFYHTFYVQTVITEFCVLISRLCIYQINTILTFLQINHYLPLHQFKLIVPYVLYKVKCDH